jgi:hypothetical protein
VLAPLVVLQSQSVPGAIPAIVVNHKDKNVCLVMIKDYQAEILALKRLSRPSALKRIMGRCLVSIHQWICRGLEVGPMTRSGTS